MDKQRPRLRSIFWNWCWPLALAVVMAGVGIGVAKPVSNQAGTAVQKITSPSTASAVSSTQIMLGVALPNAPADQLYILSLPERTVREESMSSGWRVAGLLNEENDLTVKPAQSGAAFFLTDAKDWNVSLRTRGGRLYDEPVLFGLFDATHAALTARRDDPYLLSVSRTGDIRELYQVPDTARPLLVSRGLAWFVTAQPGEGLESPLRGPSSLITVNSQGQMATAATDTQVIVTAVPGPAGVLAYAVDTGVLMASSLAGNWRGDGQPLVWLDQNTLLYARGTSLLSLDLGTGTSEALTSLPAAPQVGRLTSALP
jgi:hypothetical protein